MIRPRQSLRFLLAANTMLLAGCDLAPDYVRPPVPTAQAYKEAGDWVAATPQKADLTRGEWWRAYNDDDLNALEVKVGAANQELKAALARYDEARGAADVARADFFPTIGLSADASRNQLSNNVAVPSPKPRYKDYSAAADLSYEVDVWGRVRNAVAAGKSRADASAADLAAMDLSLRAELAMDYFALRAMEARMVIVERMVKADERALGLTRDRHDGGAAPEIDVDQAETQLNNAKTLAADTQLSRAQLEHAIAVLVGESPSSFSLPVKQVTHIPGVAVPGMPSTLLEQRPDIAVAALRVQAANADIGVARAAYFPDFTFSAAGGFESAIASKLFSAPSLIWSFGPSLAQTVFDGGRISALTDEARAAYDESVANYRQTVLVAFQQVEDNLVALRQLAQAHETQDAATAAAKRAFDQAQNRYKGGISTYLDVVINENTSLQSELNSVDIHTRQLTASVQLIKALGGGWNAAAQPAPAGPAITDAPQPAPAPAATTSPSANAPANPPAPPSQPPLPQSAGDTK